MNIYNLLPDGRPALQAVPADNQCSFPDFKRHSCRETNDFKFFQEGEIVNVACKRAVTCFRGIQPDVEVILSRNDIEDFIKRGFIEKIIKRISWLAVLTFLMEVILGPSTWLLAEKDAL